MFAFSRTLHFFFIRFINCPTIGVKDLCLHVALSLVIRLRLSMVRYV
jgi:hypothetical protein